MCFAKNLTLTALFCFSLISPKGSAQSIEELFYPVESPTCSSEWEFYSNLSEEDTVDSLMAVERINRTLAEEFQLIQSHTKQAVCTEWNIYCIPAPDIKDMCPGAGAACRPNGIPNEIPPCSIILTPTQCRAIGLTPNVQVPRVPSNPNPLSLPDLEDLRKRVIDRDSRLNCYLEVWGGCIAAEEIRHAIDISNGMSPRCRIETAGDEQSVKCMKEYYNYYCQGNRQNPHLPKDQCERLNQQIAWQELQLAMNKCICAQYDAGANPINCAQCEAECKTQCQNDSRFPSSGCDDWCKGLRGGYCDEHPARVATP